MSEAFTVFETNIPAAESCPRCGAREFEVTLTGHILPSHPGRIEWDPNVRRCLAPGCNTHWKVNVP